MKKTQKQVISKMKTFNLLGLLSVIIMSFCFVSCDNDEPVDDEINEGDEPIAGLVTAHELIGRWTLVKDEVLYSQENSSKEDKTIIYSGNSAPLYRFYNVTVSDDDIITMVEVTATGSINGSPIELELVGNDLITTDGNIAGTIKHYDLNHSWDNLRIEWNKGCAPIKYLAPVISTYMKF